MRRLLGWLSLLSGAALVVVALAQTVVDGLTLAVGGPMLVLGLLVVVHNVDVLADHPDELEMRRRRGAAGWQKPVAPPGPGGRPGGLPRRPYDRERDG